MADANDAMSEPAGRAARVDRILSICAGVAAITAVAVSLYQTALARRQLRASAWPYLSQSNSFVAGTPYTRTVSNEGVGPAMVRSFKVMADGKPVATWDDAVQTLTGAPATQLVYSTFRRGSVVQPGTSRVLLTIPAGPQAAKFWQASQTRLVTKVCYCSVYDECWMADSRDDEPLTVRGCE
jgi:hypothetical protein